MKPLQLLLTTTVFACLISCQKNNSAVDTPTASNVAASSAATSSSFPYTDNGCGPYNATLVSKINNGDGTWTWTWKIENPNPGNGLNGTVQDLSNFGVTLSECMTINNVLNAAYSQNGTSWTNVPVSYGVNPALQTCNPDYENLQMIKFDVGTQGTQPIYYRVTINLDLLVNMEGKAYYKSGSKTGCGTFCFPGFKCQDS